MFLLQATGLVLGAVALAVHAKYEVTFQLGKAEELTSLYSYPNSEDSGQTLEETLEHYLNQRVRRDLVINGLADVTIKAEPQKAGDFYNVTISGDCDHVHKYESLIIKFLENGKLAIAAMESLKKAGEWNEEEWRLFLPLGLAISNHRSVQLLRNPTDYSLTDQDYLDSKTSQRWEELLKLNDVPCWEVALYESILDIAPIATSFNAGAGSKLDGTYSYFRNYMMEMLKLLLVKDKQKALPMIAYGGPVRHWVKDFFNLPEYLGVNSIATITVDDVSVPVLGANHPSYIWYAKGDGRQKAFEVMQQDLISACWQAKMGSSKEKSSPDAILMECQKFWTAEPNAMTVCINMEMQANGLSEPEAVEKCKDFPTSRQKTEL